MTKLMLSLALGHSEHIFRRTGWSRFAETHNLQGEMHSHAAVLRYVDDILVMSKTLCLACTQKLVTAIYEGTMKFDDSGGRQVFEFGNELQASVKFLDVFVVCDYSVLQFLYANPNELWVLGLGERQKHHQRVYSVPFENHEIELCIKQLRGRRQRWIQCGLHLYALRYAVLLDVLELLQDLYPCALIKRFWLAQPTGYDRAYALSVLQVIGLRQPLLHKRFPNRAHTI